MNGLAPSWLVYWVLWGVVILLPTLVPQSTQDLGNLAHHYFILIFTSVSMITLHSGSIVNIIEPNLNPTLN